MIKKQMIKKMIKQRKPNDKNMNQIKPNDKNKGYFYIQGRS